MAIVVALKESDMRLRTALTVVLLAVVGVAGPGAAAPQQDPETSSRVPELFAFHEIIYPIWHSAYPNKDYQALRSYVPEIKRPAAKVYRASLPGILRDRKAKWAECVALLKKAVDEFSAAAEGTDDQALLDAAEALHARFESLARIVIPVIPELDAFHKVLYVVYHKYAPDKAYDQVQATVPDLLVKAAAIEKAGFAFHGLKYLQGYPELYMLTFERTRLAARADLSARDSQGRTPLDLAVRYGNRRVADALRGASVTAVPSPPAKPTALGPAPKMGEAVVWYLGHMGWAVRTANHFMVFDYDGRGVPPDEPSLASGSIDPNQIKDLSTTVFITHSHTDHYAPAVFDWKKTVKDITYVAGFKPEGKEGYGFMAPRETKTLGGLNITTTGANDEGVGFFVKADGVTILHSGDHSARAGDESFKPEIDFLAGRGLRADLLFMPVSPVNDTVMNQGVHYAMKQLSAGAVFPGHVGGREDVCGEFARDATAAGMKAPIHCPEFPGDHFAVDGRLRAQLKQAEASEADRDRTHQIDKALDGLGLRPGMMVAEVGAGPGYLVQKLARRVGPGGKVYAEDITARMLEMLKLRMADRQLANFETILGTETDPKLPAGSLDMVLICTTMHMVAAPVELLRSITPSLKPGGRLVLIEPVQGQAADPQGRAIADSHFRTREAYLKIFVEASLAVERIDATTLPFDTVFVLAPAARQHGAADAICVTTVERR